MIIVKGRLIKKAVLYKINSYQSNICSIEFCWMPSSFSTRPYWILIVILSSLNYLVLFLLRSLHLFPQFALLAITKKER